MKKNNNANFGAFCDRFKAELTENNSQGSTSAQ